MGNRNDNNYISIGQWMLLMILTAIPCVGVIAILILAFVGENESRKNYFRAIIVWFLLAGAMVAGVAMLGLWPEIQQQLRAWQNSMQQKHH